MSEMVERVAMALVKTSHAWELCGEDFRDYWRAEARRAIAAMREPTAIMQKAGGMAHCGNDTFSPKDFPEEATLVYQAMIDAALA